MNILFADDALDTRQLFRLYFLMENHAVTMVENGAEAVVAVENEAFDAIVLDIDMPAMDGWEALSRIRRLPNRQHIPIVLFSAYANYEVEERAEAAGADMFAHKPMFPKTLLMLLEKLILERQNNAVD